MWKSFSPQIRGQIMTTGVWHRRRSTAAISDHPRADRGGPQPPAARRHHRRRLPGAHPAGAKDPDVPWQHAFALTHCLPSDDVVLTLVQDGDHRLSRPQDIARMLAAVSELSG